MSFVPVRQYNKNQVILTSDRLIFNTKDDNIFFTAKKDIVLSSGGDVHINVGPSGGLSNQFILNSPVIKLGLTGLQPVPKGNNLTDTLNQLMQSLTNLATNLASATGFGVGTVTTPTINAAGTQMLGEIQNIQTLIKSINSTVTSTA
jgi:hypothetical protein